MRPSMGPPLHTQKELEIMQRIKDLEGHIQEFIGIDVDNWEEYELKHLMKRYIDDFAELLNKDKP